MVSRIRKTSTIDVHTKQIKAIKLAIGALTRERRRLFAAGESAFRLGVRKDILNNGGVTGVLFAFAEDDHQSYAEYTRAIQELEDLLEVFTDSGVVNA